MLLGEVHEVEVHRERAGDLLGAGRIERGGDALGLGVRLVVARLVRPDRGVAEPLDVVEELLPTGFDEDRAEQPAEQADIGAEPGIDVAHHELAVAVVGGFRGVGHSSKLARWPGKP